MRQCKGSAQSVLFSTTFNSALNVSSNEWKSIMSGQRKKNEHEKEWNENWLLDFFSPFNMINRRKMSK